MITAGDVFALMSSWAPVDTALGFDNVGLLTGRPEAPVERVVALLDITPQAVLHASRAGAQLIISHHPVIFSPLKAVPGKSMSGAAVEELIRGGICAICMHTNLDAADGGVNDCLAGTVGLENVRMEPDGGENIMRSGELKAPVKPEEFARTVGEKLGCRSVRFISGGKDVRRVAVCSGAGDDDVEYALEAGCDAYLTGEIRYHTGREAAYRGLTVVCAGHYETERVVLDEICRRIKNQFPELKTSVFDDGDPARCIIIR